MASARAGERQVLRLHLLNAGVTCDGKIALVSELLQAERARQQELVVAADKSRLLTHKKLATAAVAGLRLVGS